MLFFIVAWVSQAVATPFCSDSAIIANRHYKGHAFLTPENGRGPLTMENVAYSDFVKILKLSLIHISEPTRPY